MYIHADHSVRCKIFLTLAGERFYQFPRSGADKQNDVSDIFNNKQAGDKEKCMSGKYGE